MQEVTLPPALGQSPPNIIPSLSDNLLPLVTTAKDMMKEAHYFDHTRDLDSQLAMYLFTFMKLPTIAEASAMAMDYTLVLMVEGNATQACVRQSPGLMKLPNNLFQVIKQHNRPANSSPVMKEISALLKFPVIKVD